MNCRSIDVTNVMEYAISKPHRRDKVQRKFAGYEIFLTPRRGGLTSFEFFELFTDKFIPIEVVSSYVYHKLRAIDSEDRRTHSESWLLSNQRQQTILIFSPRLYYSDDFQVDSSVNCFVVNFESFYTTSWNSFISRKFRFGIIFIFLEWFFYRDECTKLSCKKIRVGFYPSHRKVRKMITQVKETTTIRL